MELDPALSSFNYFYFDVVKYLLIRELSLSLFCPFCVGVRVHLGRYSPAIPHHFSCDCQKSASSVIAAPPPPFAPRSFHLTFILIIMPIICIIIIIITILARRALTFGRHFHLAASPLGFVCQLATLVTFPAFPPSPCRWSLIKND